VRDCTFSLCRQILAAIANGSAVVLCEHTNTERGFLAAVAQAALAERLGPNCRVLVSTSDASPLSTVV
jgi:putative NIF3 family GTP cyclohydrolase 1 type 2